jgi:hypothetical protein
VHKHRFAPAFLPVVASTMVGIAAAATAGAPMTDPRLEMATALEAASPHPSLGAQAEVLGRLVGAWDVEYTDFRKDGTTRHRTGELHFGWVLDGRVLQDLWVVDPSGTSKEREVYTDLFYFEPKSGSWHVASVDPYEASVATFAGGVLGDNRIVLESHDLVPNETRRWSFNDISPSSLVFRDEASSDGGKSWTLKSEYHMRRHTDSSTAQ